MRSFIALTLALALPVTALTAQRSRAPAPTEGGLWFAAGLGGGWARVNCNICSDEVDGGAGGFLRLGGTVNPRLLIGAEVTAWTHPETSVDQSAWALSAAAYWYPSRKPLYIKAGLGYTVHHARDGVDVVTSSGVGPQFGAGYEFTLSRNWVLSPFLNTSFGLVMDDVKFNGGSVTSDVNVSLLQLGLGVLRR